MLCECIPRADGSLTLAFVPEQLQRQAGSVRSPGGPSSWEHGRAPGWEGEALTDDCVCRAGEEPRGGKGALRKPGFREPSAGVSGRKRWR